MNFRVNRLTNSTGKQFANPEKHLKEMDERRKKYYRHYTGKRWGEAKNYHIILHTGVVGMDRCADIVVGLAKR
jgi:cytidylate kinase